MVLQPMRVVVNVPAFRVDVYVGDSVVQSMPIAVGMRSFRTPRGEFSITSVECNPWWIPPDRAWARKEKPTPPGPSNPMGRVKINFQPLYFLHSTPWDRCATRYSSRSPAMASTRRGSIPWQSAPCCGACRPRDAPSRSTHSSNPDRFSCSGRSNPFDNSGASALPADSVYAPCRDPDTPDVVRAQHTIAPRGTHLVARPPSCCGTVVWFLSSRVHSPARCLLSAATLTGH